MTRLLVDGTIIKVARDRFWWVEANSAASPRELAIADSIVKDLPSPISSAIIPPRASCGLGAFILVKI